MTSEYWRRRLTVATDYSALTTSGRNYRRTLYYVAIVLDRCVGWPLSLFEFAGLWLLHIPHTVPVWGVGNQSVELFVHYLCQSGYLHLTGTEHQVRIAPAARMRRLIDRVKKSSERDAHPTRE